MNGRPSIELHDTTFQNGVHIDNLTPLETGHNFLLQRWSYYWGDAGGWYTLYQSPLAGPVGSVIHIKWWASRSYGSRKGRNRDCCRLQSQKFHNTCSNNLLKQLSRWKSLLYTRDLTLNQPCNCEIKDKLPHHLYQCCPHVQQGFDRIFTILARLPVGAWLAIGTFKYWRNQIQMGPWILKTRSFRQWSQCVHLVSSPNCD